MRKILFVVESLAGGGAEKVLLNIAKNLDRNKYDVTVYTLVETGVYVDEMKKYCKVESALKDFNSLSTFSKLIYRIKMKLIYKIDTRIVYHFLIKKKYDVEIAFVEGFSTKFVASSSNTHSKKYAWIHSDMIHNPHADIHYHSLNNHIESYKKFNQVFAVSNTVKDSYISKFGLTNIQIQYNPVDSLEILNKSHEYQNIIKPTHFNFITIGRLEKEKGYERLLQAVNKLKNKNLNFKIYILGDGSMRNEFETYITKHKLNEYVYLLGFKKNPYKYLYAADSFICSSYAEGFSTVATEALILEKPIITTNCSGMHELFGNRECGIICNNDLESLYASIKTVLEQPELLAQFRDECHIRKDFFDIRKRMKEIEVILDE